MAVNLQQWCQLDEQIYIAESDERFNQYAGLAHSEKVIERLAEMKATSAQVFLESFDRPRELWLSAVENMADSSTKKLELKLYNLRNQKIATKAGGRTVNWRSWRQFNSVEKDSKKRKQVFDDFVKKTRYISPVIKGRFDAIGDVYAKYKMNPFDGYLENEKFSRPQLLDFVKSMGRHAKKPFREALPEMCEKVLGRPAEYCGDF